MSASYALHAHVGSRIALSSGAFWKPRMAQNPYRAEVTVADPLRGLRGQAHHPDKRPHFTPPLTGIGTLEAAAALARPTGLDGAVYGL
jgi:hypothetical protein